ncbi:hypothetical protein ACYSUO_28670 [Streptomyces sp. UC4497]
MDRCLQLFGGYSYIREYQRGHEDHHREVAERVRELTS